MKVVIDNNRATTHRQSGSYGLSCAHRPHLAYHLCSLPSWALRFYRNPWHVDTGTMYIHQATCLYCIACWIAVDINCIICMGLEVRG